MIVVMMRITFLLFYINHLYVKETGWLVSEYAASRLRWHWAPHNTESHTQKKTNILNWKVTRNTAITRETIIPTTDSSYVGTLITYTVVGVYRCIEVMYSNIIYKTNVTPVSI